jgi:ppGpp synthetase/RelA/SpoT-type nucleotidyltranferase
MELDIPSVLKYYQEKQYLIKLLISGVTTFFQENPSVNGVIHTIKSRLKDPDHLAEKLQRKYNEKGLIVTPENLFSSITDLAGVRVLHLYPKQFDVIHNAFMAEINSGQWKLFEDPIAYTWDPESKSHFEELGLRTELRETYYTSIHYVVRPNNASDSPCCEIQVRTLFEEIWGEIDHSMNYPHPIDDLACREQLRVLAKLVSTGTRLADSIYNCKQSFEKSIHSK